MGKTTRMTDYKKPFRISISGFIMALLVFVIIIYLAATAYAYFSKEKISFYEVTEGSMSVDNSHTGLIIRDEQAIASDGSGYINYLVRSGKRVSVGAPIYSIDETGMLSKFLEEAASGVKLSNESVSRIKKELNSFSSTLNDDSIYRTYEVSTYLNSMVSDASFEENGAEINQKLEEAGVNYSKRYSSYSGVVSLNTDGYEERKIESITSDDFNNDSYSQVHHVSGELVENGTPVYRIVTSEDWKIVFPLSEEEKSKFTALETIKIRFKSIDITTNAGYSQYSGSDGNTYGCISLGKYMVDFIDDRFVEFDIESENIVGLKIPKSAVITKTFMTVPLDYLARGGDGLSEGFYKEVYLETGTSIIYVPTTIYFSDDENYYIDITSSGELQPGDNLVKPNTSERYKLGATANLDGVYNINKGYAVFRQIKVIDGNDEYYTVKKNQKYGLSVYDHILFNPEGINEGDFIYQ